MAEEQPPKVGRGGRGAALRQLMSNPLRRPGMDDDQQPPAPSASAPAISQPRPSGRGQALELLRQKMAAAAGDASSSAHQSSEKEESSLHKPASELAQGSRPVGRGRSVLLKSLQENNPLAGLPSQLTAALPTVGIKSSKVQPMTFEHQGERPEPIVRMGSDGTSVPLLSNYIALRCKTEGVCQYFATFEPPVDCASMRRRMVYDHQDVIGNTSAFDGMILFVPKRLPGDPMVLKSVRKTDGIEITIVLTLVKILQPQDCMQLYNIIFRKIMAKLNMCQIGRNFFLPSGAKILEQYKLEVWPGYVTSVCEFEGGVMLMMDVSHRVLRTQTALELMTDLLMGKPDGRREDIHKLLIGNMVLTRYNNKVHRIDDINWSLNPKSQFTLYNGEKMSFFDYYKKMYDITITDLEQPLLVSVPKKVPVKEGQRAKRVPELICLVPELSYMTGLTDIMRNDFRVMKELSSHTRMNPAQRRICLRDFCRKINEVPEARMELERWGFTLDTDLMEMSGRVLKEERIIVGNQDFPAGPEADWSRGICRAPVITPVDLHNWLIVVTSRDVKRAEEFVSMYQQCSRDMGISVSRPLIVNLNNDRTENFIREIRSKYTNKIQLVMMISPSQREDRYNAIKQVCCVDLPVASQVINARTISDPKKLRSVTQKIALQINCKLGGELWAVKIPTKSLMVCGIDVFHDPGRSKSSVVGFVSSMNSTCTRWYSKVRIQEPGEEMVNSLKICFIDALRKYYETNHELPARVVIYRDGVGDSQLKIVQEYEVPQLKDCFINFGDSTFQPKLTVVVVQKRINTRLLAQQMNGPENPVPGTIADHTITRRNWYDFFLVSQHIRQGTVSPTHYVVVHDESGWKPDIVQALSYKMTHLYYNWAGTVRVPAPCQYAHKLAYLIGQNVRKEPSSELCNTLYFL